MPTPRRREHLSFVVWRLTDVGPIRLRVATLAHALFWAQLLHDRWQERVWIEHAAAAAHDRARVDARLVEACIAHG